MKTILRLATLAAMLFTAASANALTSTRNSILVRMIDTGPGLAAIIHIDGAKKGRQYQHYIVIDAGHWNHDEQVYEEIRAFLPEEEKIDLMILSHSDSDHIAASDEILTRIPVDTVVRTGYERYGTKTWEEMVEGIRKATAKFGTRDVNLKYSKLKPGATWFFGGATLTMISGFHEPPVDWDLGVSRGNSLRGNSVWQARHRNSNSIVMKLEYDGRSILFTGDAVGRIDNSPDDSAPLSTEKFMLDHQSDVSLQSDVLIVPHHGSDNGSSMAFLQAVNPTWAIFSAGHDHGHPRQSVFDRLNNIIDETKILTTDRGDDESADKDWATGACEDKAFDDGIEILLKKVSGTSKGTIQIVQDGEDNPELCAD